MTFPRKEIAAHLKRGEYAEVERLCREATVADPGYGEAWHIWGLAVMGMGAPERAVQYLMRAAFHSSSDCATHINLGVVLAGLKRYSEARLAFEAAVQIEPLSFDAQYALAACCYEQNNYAAALKVIDRALAINAESFAAWDFKARNLRKMNDHDAALEAADTALRLNPALPISHRIAGDTRMRRLEYDTAHAHYLESMRLDPEDPEVRSNLGLLLTRLGRHEEAAAQYREAFKRYPDDPATQHGLSIALLTLGQLEEGWPLYAKRARDEAPLPTYAPELDHVPAAGERILLAMDQGPGEGIMFASLLPDLIRTGAELTITGDKRLQPLLERSFPEVRFVGHKEEITGPFDWQMGLPDTARWLRRSFADFPRHHGYLKADATRTRSLRQKYLAGDSSQLLVGISWSTLTRAKVSAQKTIPLAQWGPILSARGVKFVSLQYLASAEEIQAAENAFGIEIVQDPTVDALADLDGLASQAAAMDLIITTSNTTAHVAGALDVPTWTLVPIGFGGLFHWFLERSDSPWYPSMRIFRQSVQNEWQPIVDDVGAALTAFVRGKKSTP